MEREIRRAEQQAVDHAVWLRLMAAERQYERQKDVGLFDRLSQYHAPVWRVVVRRAAKAICGDPTFHFDARNLDADAYYYLQRFG